MIGPWRFTCASPGSLKPLRSSAARTSSSSSNATAVRASGSTRISSRRSSRSRRTSNSSSPRSPFNHDQATVRSPSFQTRIVHSSSRPSCWRSPHVMSPTCQGARTPSSRRCSRASSCIAAMISGVSRTYEELEVGAVYRSRHGRTVLEADNVWFTLLTMNTNPIHFDAEYAATTEWGRPLVDSTFTLALVTGMSVVDVSERAVNVGWREVTLPAPVFAGDTIHAETEVLEKRESKSRPGFVIVRTRGLNQRGEAVIEFERSILLPL